MADNAFINIYDADTDNFITQNTYNNPISFKFNVDSIKKGIPDVNDVGITPKFHQYYIRTESNYITVGAIVLAFNTTLGSPTDPNNTYYKAAARSLSHWSISTSCSTTKYTTRPTDSNFGNLNSPNQTLTIPSSIVLSSTNKAYFWVRCYCTADDDPLLDQTVYINIDCTIDVK